MDHLQQAFAFDIQMRRDIDEHLPPDGIRVVSHEVGGTASCSLKAA
jgi:ribonuclease Z